MIATNRDNRFYFLNLRTKLRPWTFREKTKSTWFCFLEDVTETPICKKLSRIVGSGLELDRVMFCFRYESTRATIEVASFWLKRFWLILAKYFLTDFGHNVSDWFWPKRVWLILAKNDSDWFWPKRFWLILAKTFLTDFGQNVSDWRGGSSAQKLPSIKPLQYGPCYT